MTTSVATTAVCETPRPDKGQTRQSARIQPRYLALWTSLVRVLLRSASRPRMGRQRCESAPVHPFIADLARDVKAQTSGARDQGNADGHDHQHDADDGRWAVLIRTKQSELQHRQWLVGLC